MLIFLCESFGDSNKSHTFASAFENDCDKPNEQCEACFDNVVASNRIKATQSQAN